MGALGECAPQKRTRQVANLDECVIMFPVERGIFGVGKLATKLKALADTDQIGPWHIGQWRDFKHTAIRIRFGSLADGERSMEIFTGARQVDR